jgi:outer membrane murein-binding lipoprotein Lpp
MKMLMPLTGLLLAGMLLAGCASHGTKKTPTSAPTASQTVVAPDNSLTARVAAYNAAGRFMVLNFPVSRMPKVDQTLFLYRNGLRVAEVKITGPQRDNNIVADLVSGDAQVGDEVRDK